MTRTELEQFRRRLRQEHSHLWAELDKLDQQLALDETSDVPADVTDVATVLVDQEELLGQIVQLQGTLAQIEKALARIADGTYGYSEVSGKPIPSERLEVLPYATTLVDEKLPER